MIKNIIKVFFLRLKNQNFSSGNKYRITLKDVFIKLFYSKNDIEIKSVLCGFPRSGTHWIRNVISETTDLYCGSMDDFNFYESSNKIIFPTFKIHARSKLIAKIKMFFYLPPHKFANKFIYIYRDPRDAIISLYNMYNVLKNVNLSQKNFLELYDPIGQYKWEINSWVFNKSKDILVIRFEDLKLNPKNVFHKICNYIDIENKNEYKGIDEFVGQVESNYKKGEIFGWKNKYNEYKFLIDSINDELNNEISHLNYPMLHEES